MMSETAERTAEAIVLRFWAVIDETVNDPGESLFLPEGTMTIETFQAKGTLQLAGYFAGRREKSAVQSRMTRHVVSNLRHAMLPDGQRIVDCLVTVFSSYGPRPAPLGPPSTVADFTFTCGTDADGQLKLDTVTGRLVFVGGDTPDLTAAQKTTGAQNG